MKTSKLLCNAKTMFLDKIPFTPKKKPVLTSRPVFQFSSSFLDSDNDENDLKKQTAHDYNQSRQLDIEGCIHQPQPPRRAHTILHILNTVLSIISLSLFIATIPIWNANFQHVHSVIAGDYTDGLVLAPLFLGLFGSLFVLGTKFLPRISFFTKLTTFVTNSNLDRRRAFLILLSFTLILLLPSALILSATNSLALLWQPNPKFDAGSGRSLFQCNLSNILTKPCQPLLYTIGGLQIGGIVTGALVWIVWIVLFVLGICECVRARKEKKERRRRRREERESRRHREGRSHGHGRRRGHRSAHRSERSSSPQDEKMGLNGAGSVRSDSLQRPKPVLDRADSRATDRKTSSSHGPRSFTTASTQQVESPAARLASHKVRPKQKMQVWLADRTT